jgi:hypothetical protein
MKSYFKEEVVEYGQRIDKQFIQDKKSKYTNKKKTY